MQVRVTIKGVEQVGAGVWNASVAPTDIKQLGGVPAPIGGRSVVLLDDAEYMAEAGELAFPLNAARVLNLGSTTNTVFIAAESGNADAVNPTEAGRDGAVKLTLGDRQLLQEIGHFPEEMKTAARNVIEHIRQIDPAGNLNRERNRYVNRRDNFVAIEPQTRNKHLLINVRGKIQTRLATLSTFNGYTAFKLSNADDLAAVLSAISAATRKVAI